MNIIQSFTRSFSRNSQQEGAQAGLSGSPNDTETDGFLVVGQTASERNAVHGSTFDMSSSGAPPQYSQVVGSSLPSYQQHSSNFHSPTLDLAQHHDISHGNPHCTGLTTIPARSPQVLPATACGNPTDAGSITIQSHHGNVNPLSGVPFQLGGGCRSLSVVDDLRQSRLLNNKTFDWSIYDYDFSLERSFLEEHDQLGGRSLEVMDIAY